MKRNAIIFLVFILAISCKSERYTPKSDLEASNLKGRVWKIEKTIFKATDKSKCPCSGLNEDKQTFYTYDEKGNLTESAKVDEDGNTVLISRYLYNRQGVCEEKADYFPGDKPAGKEVNLISRKKITEVRVLDEAGVIENISKYDYSGGELSEGKTFNKAGDLVSSFQYTYLNGQLDTRTDKNILLNASTITRYKRNTSNDISEYTVTNSADNTEYKITMEYEYDEQGNWIKQTQFYNGEIGGIILRNISYYKQDTRTSGL
jgi:hypothetical protein